MTSLQHIISDIENLAASGQLTYSFRIEHEQIAFWIHEIRSMLISQAIQKGQDISDVWVQSIGCVEMKQVSTSECCEDTSNCYVLRSVSKLPLTIETHMDNSIIRVVTASGEIISKSNPFSTKFQEYSKYTKNTPRWYIKAGYLYVEGVSLLEKVTVYGLFENPEDLADWVNCEDEECFSWDDAYPVSLKMANDITNIVFKTKIMPYFSTIPDTDNDAHNESGLLQNKNTQENKL